MKEMHPLMYCFTSLEIKAEPLPKSGKEFNYLLKYISNTHDHQVRACTRPLSQLVLLSTPFSSSSFFLVPLLLLSPSHSSSLFPFFQFMSLLIFSKGSSRFAKGAIPSGSCECILKGEDNERS